jgi:uncharacterized protein (DUF427 family)
MTEATKQVLIPGPDHPITVEPNPRRVTVTVGGTTIADSSRALVLQEASYPAVQYVPLDDVDPSVLSESDHATYCPFKGNASYYDLRVDGVVAENAVWTYREPYDAVAVIRGHVAFYRDKAAVEVHPA